MNTVSRPTDTNAAVLVVDDDPTVRRSACRVLGRAGYDVRQASSIGEARVALHSNEVSVLVLDVFLPDENGIEFLRELNERQADVDVIVLTGRPARCDMTEAIDLGAASYLSKPLDPFLLESQVAAAQRAHEVKRRGRVRSSALEASLRDTQIMLDHVPRQLAQQLAGVWDLRHVETGSHVRRIGAYSEVLGLRLGMAPDDAQTLGQVAMLHDVGKIVIPDSILTKPGKLTPEEFEVMTLHPKAGAEILGGVRHPFLERAAQVALAHHERWDGSGYPHGLRGEQCPYDARIVAVVDVYDALSEARCYKRAWSADEIEVYFQRTSGRLFDAKIVAALLESRPELRRIATSYPEAPSGSERESRTLPVSPRAPDSTAERDATGSERARR